MRLTSTLRSLSVATLAMISFLGGVCVPAAERPNLVMLFTDDQRHDAVGYSGNTAVSTPHLDRLARGGLVFENCFVSTSICCVSRANLLTGRYPSSHGVVDFFKTLGPDQLARSVPGRLQRAGYQTAFIGKWGIGDSPESTDEGKAVFDYWAGQPMQTCFFHDESCRYVGSDGFDPSKSNLCDCAADSEGRPGYHNRIGKANLETPLHVDAEVTPRHVQRFLEGRDPDKPFCLMLFFKAPHSPFGDWDERFKHVTDDLVMPTPPGASLALAKREPDVVKNSLGRESGMKYLRDPEVLDHHLRDYYRLISSMDEGVGQTMALLNEHGLDDNTVVLFTADNGHFKGEHGLAGKWLMYEPSLRAPGFIYDPRQSGGKTSQRMVITTDFSVTALALAGIDAAGTMSGRDLTALYDDPTAAWRQDFYYHHPYNHGGKLPHTVGVRSERYSYTRYIDQDPPYEQLFDLHTDPNQLTNLVELPEHAKMLKALRNRCDELAAEVATPGGGAVAHRVASPPEAPMPN